MKPILADTLPPTPWKNGGGQTRELFAWPPGADWRLRISLADIEQDGPFSPFPGVQRHFAVLEGAGVRLQFADGERLLRVGDAPLAFDGADAPGCRLIDGATRDLNLMLRGVSGTVVAASDGSTAPPGWPWLALFCAGAARLEGTLLAPRTLVTDLTPGLRLQRLDGAPAFWIGAQRPA